jgi:hypothetical protein
MRRLLPRAVLCIAAAAVSACSPDVIIPTEDIPTAGVRFINAVPDTGGSFGLDFRFVDLVESNAHFRITFRNGPSTAAPFVSTQIQYKGARAGQRHFRIFLDDTLQAIASTVVKDSTVSVEANRNYTAMLWGASRSTGTDRMKLTFFEENVADPGTQVALRVINATAGAIDVRYYAQGGTAPAAATWANVAPFSASTYVLAAPGPKMFNVQPAGGGTALFADALAIPGAAATVDVEALPGVTVAGSAVTAIVFPRSTPGTKAPQTAAFQVPAITFMWDRRPARTCTPLC